MRFSEYYKLGMSQAELDFVDIPLDTDLPLFIDPHVISTREDLFSVKCNNIIVNFFQGVINNIKDGNDISAKEKLKYLHEPNETHLGLSSERSNGKGVSGKQSLDIFERLKDSRAVKTGLLNDLSDSELVVDGISHDKISDITTNVIKKELIEYTYNQCVTYNVPTERVNSGKYWDAALQCWRSDYANLPVFDNKVILLVPKVLARYGLAYDHGKYYNGFVLEYLQQEHLNAGTALVHLLKNGKRKVYKKELKKVAKYKLKKDFLYEFSNEHPEVLETYKKSLMKKIEPLTNEQIEKVQVDPRIMDFTALKKNLKGINPGKLHANKYHNAIIGILEVIFSPNLYSPTKEEKVHQGRKRIDIVFLNAAKDGFFEYLSKHVPSSTIVCECKNYNEDPKNPELDQLSMRLSTGRGLFGLLLCRKVLDKEKMLQHCKDRFNDGHGYVVVLDDDDLLELVDYRENNKANIDKFLLNKYKQLINNQ